VQDAKGFVDGFAAEGIPATDTELTEAEKSLAKPDRTDKRVACPYKISGYHHV